MENANTQDVSAGQVQGEEARAAPARPPRQTKRDAILDFVKGLGFDSIDALRAALERKPASAPETAKPNADLIENLNSQLADATRQLEQMRERLAAERNARIETQRASLVQARLTNAHDPAAALALIKTNLLQQYEAVFDGERVDEAALVALADEARKRWPFLFKLDAPGTPSNADGRSPHERLSSMFKDVRPIRL